MYIGRNLDSISNVEKLDNITFDGSTSYALTKNSTAFVPNSAQCILISINGIVQQGNFSVNSSNIVFDSAVSSSDVCNWILHYGTGLITTVADGTITNAKLGADSVNGSKIADDSISDEHLDITAITGQTEKSSLADADKFLISDSADSGALKYVQKSNVSSPAVYTQVATVTTSTGVGHLSLPSCFTSTYTNYYVVFNRLQVGTNGADFRMLFNYGNDASNDAQYHHFSALHRYPSTSDAWSGVNQSHIKLAQAQKSGAGRYINGFMYIMHPLSTTDGITNGVWQLSNNSNNGAGSAVTVGSFGNGEAGSNSDYTGFEFFASTGNVTNGTITVYGITNPA